MYAGVAVLCIVPGILAASIYDKFQKGCKSVIKNIYFYSIVNYAAMSFAKMILGSRERTLFSCFNETDYRTYIHYGIPLVIINVLLPIIIKLLWGKDKSDVFVKGFSSTFSLITCIVFLCVGAISNDYCIAICICAFVITVAALWGKKEKIQFSEEKKERAVMLLPIILLWTVTVLIFEPNQLLLHHFEEFSIPYFKFLVIMIAEGAVLTAVCLLIGIYLLSDRQVKIFGAILFGISLAGYIQGNFLNGEMLQMDGTVQAWNSMQKAVNGLVWLIIMAAAFFATCSVRHKKICRRVIQGVCIYICLIQVLSLIFMIVTAEFPDEEKEFVLTTNHMFDLDDENNVVVFVLDWFDRQIMDDIVEQDPEFVNSLKDFTDYSNATSCYAFTALSIPYLLTGVEWEYGMDGETYCEYAYKNSDFLSDIEKQNYSMGVYTGSAYIGDSVKDKFVNYSNEVVKTIGLKKAFDVMSIASKYKMAPFAAKSFYFYTTDDIAEIVVNSGEYSISNDIVFHDELQRKRLFIDESGQYSGAFRFYHLKGAHPLFTMNEEFQEVKEDGTQISQSRGALKIVYQYIDEMKKLGIYENATIIITADHGQNRSVMRDSEIATDYDMTSTPILFVKRPNEQHLDKPNVSMAPVSHTEFMASVMEAVGGEPQKYGKTFSQIGIKEDRERIFTYVVPPDRKYRKYSIKGNSNDPKSWKEMTEQ